MNAIIMVRFVQEGFHYWPDAPPKRVYLANSHRHLFHFEVETAVAHDDREMEFHDLLEASKTIVEQMGAPDFRSSSCEAIARRLAEQLRDLYLRSFTVSVWEDDECGAKVWAP